MAGGEEGAYALTWWRRDLPFRDTISARFAEAGGALGPVKAVDDSGLAGTAPRVATSEDGFTLAWLRYEVSGSAGSARDCERGEQCDEEAGDPGGGDRYGDVSL